MIALHAVTKELGRGDQRRLVLNGIDLVIPPRSRLVVLGLPGSGKTTFLSLISGMMEPTSGWVERRCVVSATGGFARHADVGMTVRQLIDRLAPLYGADGREVARFVAEFIDFGDLIDAQIKSLPSRLHQRLNLALFYGLPCDFYLFDGATDTKLPGMSERSLAAYARRRNTAGMILATSNGRAALDFDGTAGIVFQGKLTLFENTKDALKVHRELQAEYGSSRLRHAHLKIPDGKAHR